MATKFNVAFEDGRVEEYTVKPKHILRVEREAGGLEASIESSYKLAWLSSGAKESFEKWLDTVDDIAPVEDEPTTEANPT